MSGLNLVEFGKCLVIRGMIKQNLPAKEEGYQPREGRTQKSVAFNKMCLLIMYEKCPTCLKGYILTNQIKRQLPNCFNYLQRKWINTMLNKSVLLFAAMLLAGIFPNGDSVASMPAPIKI